MTTTHHSHQAQKPASAVANSFSKRTLAIFAVCLVSLAPGISSAKKPARSPDAGCVLLLSPYPDYITAGEAYQVKMVRDPSYPGAFRSPTVQFFVTYPTTDGTTLTDETQKIPTGSFYVIYWQVGFVAPPKGEVAIGEEAVLAATVTETLESKNGKRKQYKTTVCTTTATMMEPMPLPAN